MDAVNIIPLATAVLALLGSIYAANMARDKNRADAASSLTGSALQLVNELQEQVKAGRDDYVQQAAETATIRAELAGVKAQLLEQGVLVATMKNKIQHLEQENALLRDRVRELEKENEYLREQFRKATGKKVDTGPLGGAK